MPANLRKSQNITALATCFVMSKENISTGSSHNTIAQDTKITGDLITSTDIRIDGEITGNVTSGNKIIIGPKGVVTGDIICENAEISGTLNGNALVKKLLILTESAQINGDVQMATISIEPHATLTGFCRMVRE